MSKKDNIELEIEQTVTEEAAEMKEQAKKTIQLIKEKASFPDLTYHPRW